MSSILSRIQQKHADFVAAKAAGYCHGCGKLGKDVEEELKQCAACKNAAYCNRDCQKEHWKEHKKACTTLSTGLDPEFSSVPNPSLENLHDDWATFKALQDLFFTFLADDFLRKAGKGKQADRHDTIILAEYDPSNPNKAARFPVFDAFVCTKKEAEDFLLNEYKPAEIPGDDDSDTDSDTDRNDDDDDFLNELLEDDDLDPLLDVVIGEEIVTFLDIEKLFSKEDGLIYQTMLFVIMHPDGTMHVKPYLAKQGKVGIFDIITGQKNFGKNLERLFDTGNMDIGGVKQARDVTYRGMVWYNWRQVKWREGMEVNKPFLERE